MLVQGEVLLEYIDPVLLNQPAPLQVVRARSPPQGFQERKSRTYGQQHSGETTDDFIGDNQDEYGEDKYADFRKHAIPDLDDNGFPLDNDDPVDRTGEEEDGSLSNPGDWYDSVPESPSDDDQQAESTPPNGDGAATFPRVQCQEPHSKSLLYFHVSFTITVEGDSRKPSTGQTIKKTSSKSQKHGSVASGRKKSKCWN